MWITFNTYWDIGVHAAQSLELTSKLAEILQCIVIQVDSRAKWVYMKRLIPVRSQFIVGTPLVLQICSSKPNAMSKSEAILQTSQTYPANSKSPYGQPIKQKWYLCSSVQLLCPKFSPVVTLAPHFLIIPRQRVVYGIQRPEPHVKHHLQRLQNTVIQPQV